VIDKHLVRGLDYYTRTAFEIQTDALGAQSAVAGGGRYDGLVKALGGPDQPAIGFAIGFDRLAEIVALAGRNFVKSPMVFIAALGERARAKAFDLRLELVLAGITCEMEHGDKSLKSQMKQADRINAAKVVIMGEAELDQQAVQLRDMQTKEQKAVPLSDVVKY
jgi:histidyl-tRNA synthetase